MVFYKALKYQILACIKIKILFIETIYSNHHHLISFYIYYNPFFQNNHVFKGFNNFHQIKIIPYQRKNYFFIIISFLHENHFILNRCSIKEFLVKNSNLYLFMNLVIYKS